MESSAVAYLAEVLGDDRIERRRLSGAKDRGDISALRLPDGGRVVAEVKDHAGRVEVKPWLDEAEVERQNDGAEVGVVIFKRARVGYDSAAEHGVLMTLSTLARLLGAAPIEKEQS